jgi:hypothetical protein
MKRVREKKGGLEKDSFIALLFALIIIVLIFLVVMIYLGKATSAVDFIKNLFRFGR